MQVLRTAGQRARISLQAIVALVLGAGLVFGIVWVWRLPPTPVPRFFAAIVLDASPTAEQNRRCADALRIGAQIIAQAKGAIRLTVFATGDRSTGGEPIRLGVVSRERQVKLVEQTGADGANRFLDELTKLCAAVAPRNDSPIFQALASVVRSMPSVECQQPGNTCQVWIRTDGLEESDPRIVSDLRFRTRRVTRKKITQNMPRINNGRIEVIFCGLSERRVARRAKHQPPSLPAIEAAFGREFTHRDQVRFESTCAPFEAARLESGESKRERKP